jgi:hypothetical protein
LFLFAVIKTNSSPTSNARFAGQRLQFGSFGWSMMSRPKSHHGWSVFRHGTPIIGVIAALPIVLVVTQASAQTNIDQGKSPAEIFANTCAGCHKTTRGLVNSQNSLTLPGFLQEHYTASRDQARALAAYVLASGGSGPAPQAAQKPSAERPRTAVEEPKNGEPKAGEPKNGEPKAAVHPPLHQTAKREETPAGAKLEGQKEEEGKPRADPSPAASSPEPVVGTREAPSKPVPAPETAAPPPQAVARAPMPSETPNAPPAPDSDLNPAPGATASGEAQPSDSPPVPRDNIPD